MKHRSRSQAYWRQAGVGQPLVLLNGWSASGLAWPRVWVRELERRFRVIRVDNRGSGYSRFADTPFTVGDMADDVRDVLDEAGHERATVLGLSMGGMIAQEFALRYPARVHGLMLVATRAPAPAYHVPRLMDAMSLLRPRRRGERLDAYMTRLWSRATGEGFAQREPEAISELVAQIVSRPTTQEMLLNQLRAVNGWAHAERLSQIETPTIVVHGAQDTFLDARNGRRLAELIPGARYVELERVGHLPPLEAPDTLLDLLAELTLTASPQTNGHRLPSRSSS